MKKYLVGMDEAGRGPLAGPLVCCAVACEKKFLLKLKNLNLKDSKSLSEKERKEIFKKIKKMKKIKWKVAFIFPKTIDKINILEATFLGFKRAFKKLKIKPYLVFIDGNLKIPNFKFPQRAIVKGDRKNLLISLASIIAKVKRDEFMKKISKKYPKYQFEIHKGYPTKKHLEILEKFGPCDLHRKSFKPLKYFYQK